MTLFDERMFPYTKTFKKEMLPIVDVDGRTKPSILVIIEEALRAGIEEIGLIVRSSDIPMFRNFFESALPPDLHSKLSASDREYAEYLNSVGKRITYLIQDTQEGLGHAVYCAEPFVRSEPFLLLLGDHLFHTHQQESCASQVVTVFERTNVSVVGVTHGREEELRLYGVVTGKWDEESQSVLAITEFAEKPTVEYAKEHLRMGGSDSYHLLFGIYVLKADIFTYLEENIRNDFREKGEYQLTSCLDKMREKDGFKGVLVKGMRYDIGVPHAYRDTVTLFGREKDS